MEVKYDKKWAQEDQTKPSERDKFYLKLGDQWNLPHYEPNKQVQEKWKSRIYWTSPNSKQITLVIHPSQHCLMILDLINLGSFWIRFRGSLEVCMLLWNSKGFLNRL